MQCQFSFRIENFDHCEFGRWCLSLNAVLLRNSRVFVAFAGFGSYSLLSFEWYLVIVQRWVMTETNR